MTRGTDIGARIEGLEAAAAAARGRLDDALVDEAEAVAQRAADRLRLSADHTVVAIAGATGSGKSSTFNALIGLELASVGVRRPTTSWATACVWGSQGADELLDWLGIPPRHQSMRDSMLDTQREDKSLDGVVLLDLPDHDSTEVSHHLEVDRLVQLADLLVWVLDPQKYADAAIHDRYLAPLHNHAEVTVVVLNHIDTVPEDRRQAMVDDVRRLLDADGLSRVPIFPISARHGLGVDRLRAEIADRVSAKKAARTRLDADLKGAAERISEANGPRQAAGALGPPGHRPRGRVRRRRGCAHRRLRGRAVDPDARRPRHRVAGGVVALAATARPPQAAPPRPRRCRQAAHPHRPHVAPGHHAGAARPGRHRGARARRPGLEGSRPALDRVGTPRLDVPARRPR